VPAVKGGDQGRHVDSRTAVAHEIMAGRFQNSSLKQALHGNAIIKRSSPTRSMFLDTISRKNSTSVMPPFRHDTRSFSEQRNAERSSIAVRRVQQSNSASMFSDERESEAAGHQQRERQSQARQIKTELNSIVLQEKA
jgi:hypothetical protein